MKHRTEFSLEHGLDVLSRFKPYAHQVDGIQALVNNPIFALFDEMGAGKTLQVIAAAQILFKLGVINRVLVISPASVRAVWFDPDMGELSKHLWTNTPCRVTEFHSKVREWQTDEDLPEHHLHWVITNYDFLRSKPRPIQDARVVLEEDMVSVRRGARRLSRTSQSRPRLCSRYERIVGE